MSLNEYLVASSIHGLRYVSTTEKTATRILWSLAILSCTSWASYLIYDSYYSWEASPFVTSIEMVDVGNIPFPEISMSTDITTRWRTIAYLLKKADTEGDIKELFIKSKMLKGRLTAFVSKTADFLWHNVYLSNVIEGHSNSELEVAFPKACSLKDEMNLEILQIYKWLDKTLTPYAKRGKKDYGLARQELVNSIQEEIVLHLSKVKNESLQKKRVRSLNGTQNSFCPLTDIAYPQEMLFKIAMKSAVIKRIGTAELIDLFCAFLGVDWDTKKYENDYLSTANLAGLKEFAEYIEMQSQNIPGTNGLPLTVLVHLLTTSGDLNGKAFEWKGDGINNMLHYSIYSKEKELKDIDSDMRSCYDNADSNACQIITDIFKELYSAENGTLIQNIVTMSKFGGDSGWSSNLFSVRNQQYDGIDLDTQHGDFDPFDNGKVNSNFQKLWMKPQKALTLIADLTRNHDNNSRNGIYLSARKPGEFEYNLDRSINLRLHPNEHINIEVGVDMFDVSPAIKAQPIQKRKCVTNSDKEWSLKLFQSYGAGNCQIERSIFSAFKRVGCIPVDLMAFGEDKILNAFGKVQICLFGDQLKFMAEFAKEHKMQNCLDSCQDTVYTLKPLRYLNLEDHEQGLLLGKHIATLPQNMTDKIDYVVKYFGLSHNIPYKEIPKSILKQISMVDMRFNGKRYQKIIRSLRATNNDKIALIGGTMGLFTGISFISIFEAVYWIYKTIIFKFPWAFTLFNKDEVEPC